MLDVAGKQEISARIRLVIGDRRPIVLKGLNSIFGTQHDFDVVASCSDGTSCLEAVRNLTPDVALVSDSLRDLTVTEILAITKAENLPTRLVFFTESESNDDLAAAIAADACSAISKYASVDTMLQSLRLMTKRDFVPEQSDLWRTGEEAEGSDRIERMLELLTPREHQIARLVSEGLSNKEIARRLNVSPGTVKVHLSKIFQKLEINNRTVLATLSLQRPSGLGALALAFLAITIADELKAREASNTLPNEGGADLAEDAPWKTPIIRYLIDGEAAKTLALTQSDFFAKVSQVTSAPAAMEALRAAGRSAGARLLKICGSVASSTPDVGTRLLPMSDIRTGGGQSPEHEVPRLAFSPTSLLGGYGTFATVAGALIYALHHPLLALQSHEQGKPSIDSFLAVTGENAATQAATIANADASHLAQGSLHDPGLHSASVTSGSESIAGPSRINLAALQALAWVHMAAASRTIPPHTLAWIYDSARNETIVYVNTTDHVLDIGNPGLLEIHLQGVVTPDSHFAFQPGGVAVAIALQSQEALTLAVATDETEQRADHAHGVVGTTIPETDAVWNTLADDGFRFQFEQTRAGSEASRTSNGDTVDPTEENENDDASGLSARMSSIELAHSARVTAVELHTFKSGPINADPGVLSPRPNEIGQPSLATVDSSDDAAESSAKLAELSKAGNGAEHHVPASDATAERAVTAPGAASAQRGSSEPNLHTNSGSATKAAETSEPSTAAADHAGYGNSHHASEQGPAKSAGPDTAETKSIPDSAVGDDNELHSSVSHGSRGTAHTAEPSGVEGGNAGHSGFPHAPGAADVLRPGIPTADAASPKDSQHACDRSSTKAAATEATDADSIRACGIKTGAEHSAPGSDAAIASAAVTTAGSPVGAGDLLAGSVAAGNKGGNSQEAGQSPPTALRSIKAAAEIGGASQDSAFHFHSEATPSLIAGVEPREPNNPPGSEVTLERAEDLEMIVKMVANAPVEHAANHGNNVPQPGIVPAHHELLV